LTHSHHADQGIDPIGQTKINPWKHQAARRVVEKIRSNLRDAEQQSPALE
jgi:hypothetical protein